MTPDQIRNLKPGPELDRAVGTSLGIAPRVEWYLLNADETAVATSDFESKQKAQEYHSRRMSENPTWAAKYHVGKLEIWPRFSETWAGLGLVVEEMEKRGFWPSMNKKDSGVWIVYFRSPTKGSPTLGCPYDTVSIQMDLKHAVCQSALLAIEEEGKESCAIL